MWFPYTYDRISFEAIQTNWLGEIKSCDKVSSNVVRLVVQLLTSDGSSPIALNFHPGQFVDIEIPGTHTRRSYSMASLSGDGALEFFIRILPDGAFSKFLDHRGEGGDAGESSRTYRRVQFARQRIAAALLRRAAARASRRCCRWCGICKKAVTGDPRSSSSASPSAMNFSMWMSSRRCKVEMPNLDLHVAVVEGGDGNGVAGGTVIDLLRDALLTSGDEPDIYLCGPPGMIDAAFAAAADAGVPKNQVYQEKFLASG